MFLFNRAIVALLVIPFFISLSGDGGVTFDTRGGISHNFSVFPISLLISLPFLLYGLIGFLKDVKSLLFVFFIGISIVFNYSIYGDLKHVEFLIRVAWFVILLSGFELFFEKKMAKYKDTESFMKSFSPLLPLAVFMLVVILSYFFIKPEAFFDAKVMVYNFRQYYSFITVFVIAIIADNKRWVELIIFLFLSFLLAIISDNITSIIILCLMVVYIIIGKFLPYFYTKKFFKLIVFTLVFVVFFYQLLSLVYVDIYGSNEILRFNKISSMYDLIMWSDLFLPLKIDYDAHVFDYHNQLSVFITGMGLLLSILFYFIIIERMMGFHKDYPHTRLSVALISLLAGLTTLPTMHIFLSIIITYLLAYFSKLKKWVMTT